MEDGPGDPAMFRFGIYLCISFYEPHINSQQMSINHYSRATHIQLLRNWSRNIEYADRLNTNMNLVRLISFNESFQIYTKTITGYQELLSTCYQKPTFKDETSGEQNDYFSILSRVLRVVIEGMSKINSIIDRCS